MLNELKKNKILLIAFVVVSLVFAWSMLGRESSSSSSSLLTSAAQTQRGAAVDQDIIRLLLDMRSIRLDGSVFQTPAFVLLRDFGRDIVPEPQGRPNPFAPVSGSAPSGTSDLNE